MPELDPSLFLGPCPWLVLEHALACVLDQLVDGVQVLPVLAFGVIHFCPEPPYSILL